jgi:hypothetical protein
MSDYFETYSVRRFVSMRAFMKWFVSRPRNVYVDRSASLMYYVNWARFLLTFDIVRDQCGPLSDKI